MLLKAAAHFGNIAEYNLVSKQNGVVKNASSDPGDGKEKERVFP